MKKIVLSVIYAICALAFVACGTQEKGSKTDEVSEPVEIVESSVELETQENNEMVQESWGVYQESSIENANAESVRYCLRYPSLLPSSDRSIAIAYQMDPTLCIKASNYHLNSDFSAMEKVPESIEDVLPFLKDDLCEKMDRYRDSDYEDFDFVIDSSEMVTVNGMEMCKYTGRHLFIYNFRDYGPAELPFVAYATDLVPGTGAYILVMCIDESPIDTSRDDVPEGTIEEYALKMAESLRVIE